LTRIKKEGRKKERKGGKEKGGKEVESKKNVVFARQAMTRLAVFHSDRAANALS